MVSTDAQKKASKKYDLKNVITKTIKFNKNTEKELIEIIEKEKNFSKYVKKLMLKDKENQEK